jgi:predicted permease
MNAAFNFVTPGYFETLGTPLVRGRAVSESDDAAAPRVAVVNQTFARRFFGDGEALGRRFGPARNGGPRDIEIVGVARDAKYAGLRDEVPPLVYLARAQADDGMGQSTFYVHGPLTTAELTERVRATLRRIDPRLPVVDLVTLAGVVDQALVAERLTARLAAAFGLLATLLAATGLYAVLAFSVARRTREIGVRMALGAERHAVLRLVLSDVLRLAAVGVALGLGASLIAGRLVETQLFGLRPDDPLTLAAATALLLGVVVLAGALPARRATRVDPVTALRVE